MSWGALNNQRERSSADPLPEFLTGHAVKNFNDRLEPKIQPVDDVVRKSERPYTPRSEGSRGYGVSCIGAINIQMSRKTLFVVMLFFATAVLVAFGAGYVFGTISDTFSPPATVVSPPTKKPLIPRKKTQPSAIKPSIEKDVKASPPQTSLNEESSAPEEDVVHHGEKKDSHVLSETKNNKETNDSETIYKEQSSTPAANSEDPSD